MFEKKLKFLFGAVLPRFQACQMYWLCQLVGTYIVEGSRVKSAGKIAGF